MTHKPPARDRNGRRTITVDLKPDVHADLAFIAARNDVRPSTMAGLLLRTAIAETLAAASVKHSA
jgi:hypothetical protein